MIRPIPREVIMNRGTGDRGHSTAAEGGLQHPVQETCSNGEKETTSSISKVNPINISSGHEMMKEVDKEGSKNEAKRKQLKYLTTAFKQLERVTAGQLDHRQPTLRLRRSQSLLPISVVSVFRPPSQQSNKSWRF